jgi:hypothetical protein
LTDRVREWKDSASLKTHRPLLAALMLIAWVLTSSHIVLEHGGGWWGCHAEAGHDGGHHHHHHEDSDLPGEPHHHHDLGVVLLGKAVAVHKAAPAPSPWTPLVAFTGGQFTPTLRIAPVPLGWTTIGDSPPDARSSGWLLVAHTARPVRGPAPVA